ncbi:GntR family transcriptional regulator [Actinokineospora sp. NPDC004072]
MGGFEAESERVVRRLRDEIIDGVRRPGSRLVERELAAELGVSRVPVRDALRVLVAEGLVVARPRTWAVVREFTAADVSDLAEVRAAFEPLVFRLAAQRRTGDGLRRLRVVVAEGLAAAKAGDGVLARRAAADFHEVVTELAANELLIEVHRPLRSRMRWFMGQHDDLVAVAEQHAQLCEAIADRDVERVDRLVAGHMANGRFGIPSSA